MSNSAMMASVQQRMVEEIQAEEDERIWALFDALGTEEEQAMRALAKEIQDVVATETAGGTGVVVAEGPLAGGGSAPDNGSARRQSSSEGDVREREAGDGGGP